MVHRQIREAFWNVVKIFFGKKLEYFGGLFSFIVLGITLIFYQLPFWDNAFIKDIIVWFCLFRFDILHECCFKRGR